MICGLDEAGRGPLAGPVCAAAVILPRDFPGEILGDSKKLSPLRREAARRVLYERAFWGIGWASAAEIDEINILQASLLAMKRAYGELLRLAAFPGLPALQDIEAVADGLYAPDLSVACRAMVKADAQVPEVMAASILAKTARDRMMERYAWLYPEYGYDRHKGYPTRDHLERIARHGPSPIQRNTFKVKTV
ncbi:MAG: ribonuclease HII [Treponema sp.]|jgi:ribonuclease HII|nr:ribonuclease HII [Treponema sp.]